MKTYRHISSLLIALFISGFIWAQDYISVKELSSKLNDDNLVLVSARKTNEYKKVHIKGAINLYPGELENENPVKSTIKNPDEIAQILGSKGISEKNEIVIYCNKGTNAGRLYWILKYMGAENVKILDGHMDAWKKGRKPITKQPSNRKPSNFNPNIQKDYLCRLKDVKKASEMGDYVVIDAREIEEYTGAKEDKEIRLGHIPGAVNIPISEMMDDNLLLKKPEQLKEIFLSKGVSPDKTVIIYCKSSYRAGLEFMVLKSILKYPNVKVYDGAMYEWNGIAANEVVK